VRRQDFAYHLPADLIAQEPPAERSAGRMLVLDGISGAVLDRTIRDLPGELRQGDLLVVNDTRVIAARLIGTKLSGGRVEILLERPLAGQQALAQLAASKPVRPGLEVVTAGGVVRVLGREAELWRIGLPAPAVEFFERFGEVPLPPYIRRTPQPSDRERYQSIFAREAGAVAAPTASLHFDEALTAALAARRVRRVRVTLHVGAGTFKPLRSEDVAAHVIHPERASVGAAACEAITATRAAGGRVVAVGTTVVRALESAALAAGGARVPATGDQGQALALARGKERQAPALAPWQGETRLFITPGFRFRVCDVLLTNFHLPESTLLMLVCAFAGTRAVLEAYAHAVREQYRFFSYGDAMLITREASA
jgi:S-adenosylmethionine:tRNA ribosyltransferase-isomerase